MLGDVYVPTHMLVCLSSEVASHKEKQLKAPFDLHLLFISMCPDMFFFCLLQTCFPLIVSSKWRG